MRETHLLLRLTLKDCNSFFPACRITAGTAVQLLCLVIFAGCLENPCDLFLCRHFILNSLRSEMLADINISCQLRIRRILFFNLFLDHHGCLVLGNM